jgi:hypothetical protein
MKLTLNEALSTMRTGAMSSRLLVAPMGRLEGRAASIASGRLMTADRARYAFRGNASTAPDPAAGMV